MKICNLCIYDSRVPGIYFDCDGICNYCAQIKEIKKIYGTGTPEGEFKLEKILDDIKKKGKRRRYDCIVGVSGGTDSSFLLMKAVEWGLRPLAVHYDNTWNTGLASANIFKLTSTLNIPLETYIVDNHEVDEIKKAFLKATVAEFDADTDLAFVQVLRMTAAKYRIKFILEGHSFQTEGVSPVGGNYLDGGYINDIVKKYSNKKIKNFPNLTFFQFLKWIIFYRQKFIRPLWYVSYDKDEAREELMSKIDWKYYGGHHLENRASSFAHTIWLPKKFNTDYRYLSLGAKVREGRMNRAEALQIMSSKPEVNQDLLNYVMKRLDLSEMELHEIFSSKNNHWSQFKTYKKRFEKMRAFFWLMMKFNLIPQTFYLKYCKKSK